MIERFLAKVEIADSGCHEWRAYRTPDGYGRFQVGTSRVAHRVAYELFVGPIPEGLEIHHKCRNRGCVNPEHLEPVTHLENLSLDPIGAHNARKTHCPRGHPYTGDNLARFDGRRHCKQCNRLAQQRFRKRKNRITSQ